MFPGDQFVWLKQLILRKIINIVAARCHIIFKAKMHQIRFRLGLRPRPHWGAHNAPPDLLNGFEGVLLLSEGNRIGGKGRGVGRKERGRRKEGKREICVMAFGDGHPCDFTRSETVRPI